MLIKAVRGTRRYEIFAIPPVSGPDLNSLDYSIWHELVNTISSSQKQH